MAVSLGQILYQLLFHGLQRTESPSDPGHCSSSCANSELSSDRLVRSFQNYQLGAEAVLQKDNGLPRAGGGGGGGCWAGVGGGGRVVAKQSGNQNISLNRSLRTKTKPTRQTRQLGHFPVLSPTFLSKKSKPHEKVSGEWLAGDTKKRKKRYLSRCTASLQECARPVPPARGEKRTMDRLLQPQLDKLPSLQ